MGQWIRCKYGNKLPFPAEDHRNPQVVPSTASGIFLGKAQLSTIAL